MIEWCPIYFKKKPRLDLIFSLALLATSEGAGIAEGLGHGSVRDLNLTPGHGDIGKASCLLVPYLASTTEENSARKKPAKFSHSGGGQTS